jgi:uncharacterized protein YkwD
MTFTTLLTADACLRRRQFIKLSVRFALLACAFCMWDNALAQGVAPRPIARLISEPTVNAPVSRARRVTLEETSATPPAANATSLETPTEVEQRAFEQTNSARLKSGLAPMVWDSELCRMARAHSENMARRGFFSHETPEGLQLKERAHENGIAHFRVIAENIAYNKGYSDPGGFAVERWMISSGHRANILYIGFQASAIGSYVAADGSTYLTQVFIAR